MVRTIAEIRNDWERVIYELNEAHKTYRYYLSKQINLKVDSNPAKFDKLQNAANKIKSAQEKGVQYFNEYIEAIENIHV